MARLRNPQELIHWLEVGVGARWIRWSASLLAIVVLSLLVAWKQFHGATSEGTLVQADVGRQLARGEGFTTLVNYPQTVAFLEQRGIKFDARHPYPELHQAPLYSMLIAGSLRLLPETRREALFASAPVAPDGFKADYLLLGLNIVLLWATAFLTFDLARRLFDVRVAWVASLALLLSVGIWQQTVIVNGTPLLMLLAVAAFWFWARADAAIDQDASGGVPIPEARDTRAQRSSRFARTSVFWLGAVGATCGLLFLTEYSAGSLVFVAFGYAVLRLRGSRRWLAAAVVALGFTLVAGPWVVRNIRVSAHAVGLAAQNVALKQGDPTAEPETQRNTLSADLPAISLNKLGNKTLTGLQESLKSRLWSGGAMWFAAFFVTGWLYTFRSGRVNRLRWVLVAAMAVLILAQSAFNSGESERFAAAWIAPVLMIFGAGFFFVLLGSNAVLGRWPRLCATVLLLVQALPLLHDALEPRRLHFQYPPYFPGLFIGMREELARRDSAARFGVMADVPAGVAWYGQQRVWAKPVRLRDFYAITLEQPMGELLLTPRTLDRPFFTELAAQPVVPDALGRATNLFGEWGRIYGGLLTGRLPPEFPLSAPQKLAENLYVMLNPALPPPTGK